MRVEEITENVFDSFAQVHFMKNHFQSIYYAKVMKNSAFNTMYVGIFENNVLKGASLILYKNIAPTIKYGYAPRGFLIDYYDEELLKNSIKPLKQFFWKKGLSFVRINPEITLSIVDPTTEKKLTNKKNKTLISFLKSIGFNKVASNSYSELLLPKLNPIINFNNYDFDSINNLFNSKFSAQELKGIKFKIGNEKDLEPFYSIISKPKTSSLSRIQKYYSAFKDSDMIDLFLIKINYSEQLRGLQKAYHLVSEENLKINENFSSNPTNSVLYDEKMVSDNKLNEIKHNIKNLTNIIKTEEIEGILAGALIIKYEGRVSIILSGYKKDYKADINFYLYYKIIEEYKKAGYKFMDLNKMKADFSKEGSFKESNKFKLQFNPITYEYIGEMDLIVNSTYYQILSNTGLLKKEFSKTEIK